MYEKALSRNSGIVVQCKQMGKYNKATRISLQKPCIKQEEPSAKQ